MTTTEATDFDIARLRARRTNKWHKFQPDVLPAWVADMDFGVAPSITAALARLTRDQEYGYAARDGVLAAAFVAAWGGVSAGTPIPPTRSRSAIWCRPASPRSWRSANRATQSCCSFPPTRPSAAVLHRAEQGIVEPLHGVTPARRRGLDRVRNQAETKQDGETRGSPPRPFQYDRLPHGFGPPVCVDRRLPTPLCRIWSAAVV